MLATKIEHATFVVTISEYNRQFLQRLYGAVAANKLRVIHCGIDPEVFQPRARQRLTLPSPCFVWAGSKHKKAIRI